MYTADPASKVSGLKKKTQGFINMGFKSGSIVI